MPKIKIEAFAEEYKNEARAWLVPRVVLCRCEMAHAGIDPMRDDFAAGYWQKREFARMENGTVALLLRQVATALQGGRYNAMATDARKAEKMCNQ